jgi:hypothetical protein
MKYAVKTELDVMICIPSSIKTRSETEMIMGRWRDIQTYRDHGYRISTLLFLLIKKVGQRNKECKLTIDSEM